MTTRELLKLAGSFLGANKRSRSWYSVRKDYIAKHPVCEISGSSKDLEVHHIIPVGVDPGRELDPSNLMTLNKKYHLYVAHLGWWRRYNPDIRCTARTLQADFQIAKKI